MCMQCAVGGFCILLCHTVYVMCMPSSKFTEAIEPVTCLTTLLKSDHWRIFALHPVICTVGTGSWSKGGKEGGGEREKRKPAVWRRWKSAKKTAISGLQAEDDRVWNVWDWDVVPLPLPTWPHPPHQALHLWILSKILQELSHTP